jgi:hypothetical protein
MIAKAGAYEASPKYGVCHAPEIRDCAAGRLILGKL